MPAPPPVDWSDSALADLRQVMEYIADDDPEAATRTGQRIWDAASRLEAHPGLGRPGRITETRELVISGTPYILPYSIVQGRPTILRVLHGARKWP